MNFSLLDKIDAIRGGILTTILRTEGHTYKKQGARALFAAGGHAPVWGNLGSVCIDQELVRQGGEALADVAFLRESDPANQDELREWERKIRLDKDQSAAAHVEGQVHLLHLLVVDPAVSEQVVKELGEGADFSSLVVRFSVGPAAARGGDIGWMVPEDMVEPMRSAIAGLGVDEISPPVESEGLIHIFKRIP